MHELVLWMQEKLLPFLGPWGIVVIAFFDSSFLSLPEVNDIFLVTESSARPGTAWMYVIATTVGSVLGCSALWFAGKRGGEPLLVRRFGAERVEQTRQAFRRWDILALAMPALLPPPMPFKIFVFSAGVFGVPYKRFVVAIAAARGTRYAAWGVLGMLYGRTAIGMLLAFDTWFDRHDEIIVPVAALSLVLIVLIAIQRRRWAERRAERPSA
jgi:membrane protein YqaA with SNARE-associated domain